MGPGRSELKGCLELYTFAKSLQNMHTRTDTLAAYIQYALAHTCTLSDVHLWLQHLSAKCQPDKSQGLRVKWNINILTNRGESQESIMLSSPTGDDFISVIHYPQFALFSVKS